MHILRKATSNMLCCFGLNGHDELQQSVSPKKTAANNDTPISMSVHDASVPHTLDSPEVLHKIFASNASQRGYSAVQPAHSKYHAPQGSLDFSFRFGSGPPGRKSHSRLEQLTQHVKQKLSESRLSQASGQTDSPDLRSVQLSKTFITTEPDAATQLLGRSQTSIGLTELLASRAASEGGYDSNAKSIQTPTVLSARDTYRLRTQTLGQSIATIGGCPTDKNSRQLNDSTNPLTETSILPSEEVLGSSILPEASQTMSFWEALQMDPCEPQIDENIALETIKSSGTPNPRAICVPAGLETEVKSSPSPSVPHQDSDGLNEEGQLTTHYPHKAHMQRTKSKLIDHEATPTHECTAPIEPSSLAMHPDPLLLDKAKDLQRSIPTDHSVIDASPETAVNVRLKQVTNAATLRAVSISELKPIHATKANMTSSDQQSLHLFDMRISQRLASSSRIPMLSSANISNKSSNSTTSLAHPYTRPQRRTSSLSRGPTFITVEHNRCPSDPETRKLFENPSAYPARRNKRSLSDGSIMVSNEFRNVKASVIDDSSSYYGSVMDGATSDPELSIPPRTRGLLVNTHSFAVGGRSASGPVPRKAFAADSHRMGVIGHDEKLKLDVQDSALEYKQGRNNSHIGIRSRGVSMTKPSKFIKIDSTPTPVARRFQSFTDANENMSEIGMDGILQHHEAVNGSQSIQATEDRRIETPNDLNPDMSTLGDTIEDDKVHPADAWLTQGQRTGWGFDFAKDKPGDNTHDLQLPNKGDSSSHDPVIGWQDCTSDVWLKAFRRLGGPDDRGNLLETPQFDREGRRRSSITSVSDLGPHTRKSSLTSTVRRRSQSVDPSQHGRVASLEAQKKRRKSVPMLRDFGLNVPHKKSYTLLRRSKLQKSSLADLGRRVLTAGVTSEPNKSSKEFLGKWGRFASHTREQRNGSAGPVDKIKIRDFCNESNKGSPEQASTPVNKSVISTKVRPRGSWNLRALTHPALKRQNTKGMVISISSAERAKYRRNGVIGRFRRLYRTKSSELQMFTTTQGHRGSISTGLSAEYPELECLPGQGALEEGYERKGFLSSRMDGTTDQDGEAFLDTISEVTSKRSKSMRSYTIPWRKRDAEEWSKLYQDCIGSFSALKSDSDLQEVAHNMSIRTQRTILSSSTVLRESTVNFEADLRKDATDVKERLLQQLQSSDEVESGLRMPGSFV